MISHVSTKKHDSHKKYRCCLSRGVMSSIVLLVFTLIVITLISTVVLLLRNNEKVNRNVEIDDRRTTDDTETDLSGSILRRARRDDGILSNLDDYTPNALETFVPMAELRVDSLQSVAVESDEDAIATRMDVTLSEIEKSLSVIETSVDDARRDISMFDHAATMDNISAFDETHDETRTISTIDDSSHEGTNDSSNHIFQHSDETTKTTDSAIMTKFISLDNDETSNIEKTIGEVETSNDGTTITSDEAVTARDETTNVTSDEAMNTRDANDETTTKMITGDETTTTSEEGATMITGDEATKMITGDETTTMSEEGTTMNDEATTNTDNEATTIVDDEATTIVRDETIATSDETTTTNEEATSLKVTPSDDELWRRLVADGRLIANANRISYTNETPLILLEEPSYVAPDEEKRRRRRRK